jgi:hypothetical protein
VSTSVVVAIAVCAGLFGLQAALTNRKGTESQVRALLGGMFPNAWNFVALEYCHGVLNRTYVVFVTDGMICGARVRGPLPAPLLVTERWTDPYFFPRLRLVKHYMGVDLTSADFKRVSRANFQIPRREIAKVWLDSKPKWGMGSVPYSGRIHLRVRDGETREWILLGKQDGPSLVGRLEDQSNNSI